VAGRGYRNLSRDSGRPSKKDYLAYEVYISVGIWWRMGGVRSTGSWGHAADSPAHGESWPTNTYYFFAVSLPVSGEDFIWGLPARSSLDALSYSKVSPALRDRKNPSFSDARGSPLELSLYKTQIYNRNI
jgi:hypothetical protein